MSQPDNQTLYLSAYGRNAYIGVCVPCDIAKHRFSLIAYKGDIYIKTVFETNLLNELRLYMDLNGLKIDKKESDFIYFNEFRKKWMSSKMYRLSEK